MRQVDRKSRRFESAPRVVRRVVVKVTAGLLLVLAAGCGAPSPEGGGELAGVARGAMKADNGLVLNGIVVNGLSNNGLTTNGLASRGLVPSALDDLEFINWFNSNAESFSDMVMYYLVRCAAPAGTSLSWTNPSSATAFTWSGELGLAPYWTSGAPIREDEQQLVTACLAASVNKFGVHVSVSLLGRTAGGALIPVGAGELEAYSQREACFFGNLFNGDGALVGTDAALAPQHSSSRACGIHSQPAGDSIACSPMIYTSSCASLCTFDPVNQQYTECTYNGRQYKPLTSRIQPQDVYLCGDGVCQISERCGTGNTYDSCEADCGACP